MEINKHYAAILAFYGDKKAARSGVPLIKHINEGLYLLSIIGSAVRAKEAFCIHPLLQDDEALQEALKENSVFLQHAANPEAIVLAMEYRRIANTYLSHHCKDENDAIELGCLPEVKQMLIADKVQNRKDFERHHLGTHPNSDVLALYFRNWLRKLEISEERYLELVGMLESTPAEPERLFGAT